MAIPANRRDVPHDVNGVAGLALVIPADHVAGEPENLQHEIGDACCYGHGAYQDLVPAHSRRRKAFRRSRQEESLPLHHSMSTHARTL